MHDDPRQGEVDCCGEEDGCDGEANDIPSPKRQHYHSYSEGRGDSHQESIAVPRVEIHLDSPDVASDLEDETEEHADGETPGAVDIGLR